MDIEKYKSISPVMINDITDCSGTRNTFLQLEHVGVPINKPMITLLEEIRTADTPIIEELEGEVNEAFVNMIEGEIGYFSKKPLEIEEFIDQTEGIKVYITVGDGISDCSVDESEKHTSKKPKKIKFEIMRIADVAEAIYHPNIEKIKRMKIYLDNGTSIFNGKEDEFETIKFKNKNGDEIKCLSLTEYGVPTISIQFYRITVELEVDDDFDSSELKLVYAFVKDRSRFHGGWYELATQDGELILVGDGVAVNRFSPGRVNYLDGTMMPDLKQALDDARIESKRRKNLIFKNH